MASYFLQGRRRHEKLPQTESSSKPESFDFVEDGGQGQKQDREQHTKPLYRPRVKTILLQSFSLAWIAPIIALLVLNFQTFIIGASAWCPGGKCWPERWNPNSAIPQAKLDKFGRESDDLLAVLQIVAKVLETWFVFVAGTLVYSITVWLASRKEGLPIGFLPRPHHVADIRSLFDPLLWKSVPHHLRHSGRAPRGPLWALIFGAIVLCLLCNLMGPAVAVLAIPKFGWLDTPNVRVGSFLGFNAGDPPSVDGFALEDTFNCTASDFEQQKFSCTSNDWANKLDGWLEAWVTSAMEGSYRTTASESLLTFSVNATESTFDGSFGNLDYWVPSRQLINDFSNDAQSIALISQGAANASSLNMTESEWDAFHVYNISSQVALQRTGPILGFFPNSWAGYDHSSWTTTVDESRALRCFANYTLPADHTLKMTKCIQVGNGWGSQTKNVSFSIGSLSSDGSSGSKVSIEAFSSNHVAMLPNGILPNGVDAKCIQNGTIPASIICDWDAFFTPTPQHANISAYVSTLQMTYPTENKTAFLTFDYVAYAAVATYSLDPSALTNPLLLVQTPSVPTTGDPIPVDPAWTLAAWSVENGGELATDRSVSRMLSNIMNFLASGHGNVTQGTILGSTLSAVAIVPAMQVLSIIDYNTTDEVVAGARNLYATAKVQVWSYNMTSRASVFAATIAIIGIVLTVMQVTFSVWDSRRFRTPIELLTAALEHEPRDEFARCRSDNEAAMIRFQIRENASPVQGLVFRATGTTREGHDEGG